MTVIDRHTLLDHLDMVLEASRFKDYGPNGLQVEGKREISRVISGVTASRALIEAAIAAKMSLRFIPVDMISFLV